MLSIKCTAYTVAYKNVAVKLCQQLWQILTKFDHFCIKLTCNIYLEQITVGYLFILIESL